MNNKLNLAVPEIHKANRPYLLRLIGKTLHKFSGWEVKGAIPNINKFILAAGPHTSNWDFINAVIFILSIDLKLNFLIKHTVFIYGFKTIFKKLGCIPVDRNNPNLVVEQLAKLTNENNGFILIITPEGTRKKVKKWKTGFLRIAKISNCKIVPVGIDYPSKTFNLGEFFEPTGHNDTDIHSIKSFFENFQGKHPEKQ